MKRIIIAGGRDFDDVHLVALTLSNLLPDDTTPDSIQIVSGGAKGADAMGELVARDNNINLAIFPAQWDTHGKRAGYVRNQLMADNADVLLAFWNETSKGTKHMIDIAKRKNLEVHIIIY